MRTLGICSLNNFHTYYIAVLTIVTSSVQLLSSVQLFATPWIAARQASLSITNSWSLHKPMSIELVMPSSHLILCHPLLLLPPILPSIRVFSNASVAQSCPTLYDPMDCSTPAFPAHHQLPELAQTHVHPVGNAIQPSHPLVVHFSSCLQSFPALNKSNLPKYKSCIFQKCKFVLAFKKKIKAIHHTNRI